MGIGESPPVLTLKTGGNIMSKRWITLLLVFCLVLSNIAPAAGAVSFGPSNGAGGSSSGIFDGLIDAAEKLLGISL